MPSGTKLLRTSLLKNSLFFSKTRMTLIESKLIFLIENVQKPLRFILLVLEENFSTYQNFSNFRIILIDLRILCSPARVVAPGVI